MKEFDYVGLCETWLDEKGWNRIKEKLPKSRIWKSTQARKDKVKGRAKGEILIGKIKEWDINDDIDNTKEIGEGTVLTRISEGDMNINIYIYDI